MPNDIRIRNVLWIWKCPNRRGVQSHVSVYSKNRWHIQFEMETSIGFSFKLLSEIWIKISIFMIHRGEI